MGNGPEVPSINTYTANVLSAEIADECLQTNTANIYRMVICNFIGNPLSA